MYPERLHRAIVYPSGMVFYAAWNLIIKWFMDQVTRDKVYPARYYSDVQELVDEKYIPKSMVMEKLFFVVVAIISSICLQMNLFYCQRQMFLSCFVLNNRRL